MGAASGFSVQIAHFCGSKDFRSAREVMRKGLVSMLFFGLLMGLSGLLISRSLPVWLGGSEEINSDATGYFSIFSAFMPMMALSWSAGRQHAPGQRQHESPEHTERDDVRP